MPITFTCSETGKKLTVKESLSGKKIKCPLCGETHAVPLAGIAPPVTSVGHAAPITSDDTNPAESAFDQARRCAAGGKLDKAIDCLEEALRRHGSGGLTRVEAEKARDASSSHQPLSGHWIQTVVSVCAVVVSVFSVGLSVWTVQNDRRERRFERLILVNQYLHQSEFSEARSAVRQGSIELTAKDPQVRRVCSSFDFASMLARQGAIDKDLFLDYWRPSLILLAKRLAPLWNESLGEGITFKDYYKDFYSLLEEVSRN